MTDGFRLNVVLWNQNRLYNWVIAKLIRTNGVWTNVDRAKVTPPKKVSHTHQLSIDHVWQSSKWQNDFCPNDVSSVKKFAILAQS
jgi:hypothetical protein